MSMETNSDPIPQSKPLSFATITAILIAIAALMLGLQNLYSGMRDRALMINQMKHIEKNVTDLQNSPTVTTQRTLSTIQFLVHLADLHLTVDHNPKSALSILMMAKTELDHAQQNHFGTLKQALNNDIAQLQSASHVDINSVFLTISHINAEIQALSPIPAQPTISIKNTVDSMKTAGSDLPWYHRLWESAKQVKNLFIIRQLNTQNVPLFSAEIEATVKQNMLLQLNMAQWALLHHDQKIFQSALQNTMQMLSQHFALSAAMNPILTQLKTLENTQIDATLPNLNNTMNALSSLNGNTISPVPQSSPPSTTPEKNPATPPKKTTPASVET